MIRTELARTPSTATVAAVGRGPGGGESDFARAALVNPAQDLHIACQRGEVLFAEGDAADEVFVLIRGCVRLVKLMSDGRRQIIAFLMPGQLAGLTTAAEHTFSAEAVGDCVVIRQRRGAVEARMGIDPAFAAAMRATAADALQNAYDRMMLVCRRPAAARVAWFLLTMRRHAGCDTFRLPMSRADVADYLGMALETASRAFTQLKKRKAITATSTSIVTLLDRALVERIAEAA